LKLPLVAAVDPVSAPVRYGRLSSQQGSGSFLWGSRLGCTYK
jgi:hypothetical protein